MDTAISRSMLYISNGFLGVTSRKGYGIMLVAKGSYEDESGQTQYTLGSDAMNAVEYAELKAPQTLADRVVHEATRMRHARALTAEDRCNDVSLVFEPSLAPVFWGDVISAMQGKAVADGMSFLQDHFGEAVLPSDISVVNDPTIKGTLYHRYFDKDGLPASRHVMVDNGVIRNWFLDLYNARKLGMSPTGEIDNVLIESSGDAAQDLNALIRDIDTGIVVTDFNGGGMDTVMGQYQAGAKGILIRRGEMVEPVRDFSLAHNDLHAMLATTRIAGDHERKGRFRVPSTRVDGLTLSA